MKTQEELFIQLRYLEKEKKIKIDKIKEESKFLTDIHSILRMKNLIDSWVELNFESEIIYKTLF